MTKDLLVTYEKDKKVQKVKTVLDTQTNPFTKKEKVRTKGVPSSWQVQNPVNVLDSLYNIFYICYTWYSQTKDKERERKNEKEKRAEEDI